MNPIVPPFVPFPPPPRVRPFPPPPPPENPFPTLDTEPMATKAELNAEIARATAAESGIVAAATEAAVAAAVESVDDELDAMRASVTAAVSGANAAADRAARVTSGVATQAAREAVAGAMEAGFIKSSQAAQIADAAAQGVLSVVSVPISNIPSKADKSYVDACLKKAVVMTQSPDGLSQIQIGNDGVPFVLKKTITATHENQAVCSGLVFGWTPVSEDDGYNPTQDMGEEFFAASSGGYVRLMAKSGSSYGFWRWWHSGQQREVPFGTDGAAWAQHGSSVTVGSGTVDGWSYEIYSAPEEFTITRRNIVTEAAT